LWIKAPAGARLSASHSAADRYIVSPQLSNFQPAQTGTPRTLGRAGQRSIFQ
jgi:hypothetical protein